MDRVSKESLAWMLEKSLSQNNSQFSSVSPRQALILTSFAVGSFEGQCAILANWGSYWREDMSWVCLNACVFYKDCLLAYVADTRRYFHLI